MKILKMKAIVLELREKERVTVGWRERGREK